MNKPSHNSTDEAYLLGQSPEAHHRLLVQGRMVNAFTRRVCEEAGIARGMQVLDVGCGPGDVSLLVAELVGETGSVLGIDQREEPLQMARSRAKASALPQVSFLVSDLRQVTLDQEFDAIVGRFILAHLPESRPWDNVSEKCARDNGELGPGGFHPKGYWWRIRLLKEYSNFPKHKKWSIFPTEWEKSLVFVASFPTF